VIYIQTRVQKLTVVDEFLIDPILLGRAPRPLAPAPRGEPAVEADDDDDRMAPLDPLPATSSDEKPEDASDADVPKLFEYFTPPRYPSPPPMIDHYAFQHGARVDGADVAVEDSSQQQEQLSELINGLNIRKRPFEDNVEPQHEGSTTEEEMIPKKRILRLPHWAINNKKGSLRAKSGGGSATEQDGGATPIEHEVQQPDLEAEPAVTSGEHTSDDSTNIAAALNHLSIDTLEAGLTPDQVAAAIAQLYISRLPPTPTPQHGSKRARRG